MPAPTPTCRGYPVVNGLFLGLGILGLVVAGSLEVTPANRVYSPWLGRELPELCVYRAGTGAPCRSCGITRAVVCAAHGDWERSRAFHPAGVPILLMLLVQCAMRAGFLRPRLRSPALDLAASSLMLLAAGALLNVV